MFNWNDLAPIYNHGFFRALVAQAQKVSDPAIRSIRMTARRHGVLKQFHDVVGYYNRFDIFNLTIDRTPLEPAHFIDAPAAESANPDHARPGQLENGELSLRDFDRLGALS